MLLWTWNMHSSTLKMTASGQACFSFALWSKRCFTYEWVRLTFEPMNPGDPSGKVPVDIKHLNIQLATECAHLRSDRPIASFIHESPSTCMVSQAKMARIKFPENDGRKISFLPYSKFSGKSSMLVKETIILEGPNFHSAMNSTEPWVLTGNLLCQVSQPIPLPTSLARNRNLPIYKEIEGIKCLHYAWVLSLYWILESSFSASE